MPNEGIKGREKKLKCFYGNGFSNLFKHNTLHMVDGWWKHFINVEIVCRDCVALTLTAQTVATKYMQILLEIMMMYDGLPLKWLQIMQINLSVVSNIMHYIDVSWCVIKWTSNGITLLAHAIHFCVWNLKRKLICQFDSISFSFIFFSAWELMMTPFHR